MNLPPLLPKPDCVHLWISDGERQPMRCVRCGRSRADATFLHAMSTLLAIGCVMLAVACCVVVVAQIAIYIAHHQML